VSLVLVVDYCLGLRLRLRLRVVGGGNARWDGVGSRLLVLGEIVVGVRVLVLELTVEGVTSSGLVYHSSKMHCHGEVKQRSGAWSRGRRG
jgi:hypothetical protein